MKSINLVALGVAIGVLVALQALYDATPPKLTISATTPRDNAIEVFFDISDGYEQETSQKIPTKPVSEPQNVVFDLPPGDIYGFRIDIVEEGAVVDFHAMTFRKLWWSHRWTARDMADFFTPNAQLEFSAVDDRRLEATTRGIDPYFETKPELRDAYQEFIDGSALSNLAVALFAALAAYALTVWLGPSLRRGGAALSARDPAPWTAKVRRWIWPHRHWLALVGVHLALLFVLAPGFFLGSRYIYPDIHLKYPVWSHTAVSKNTGVFSPTKSDFLSAFYNRKDQWDAWRQGESRRWNHQHSFGRPLAGVLFYGNEFPLTVAIAKLFSPPLAFGLIAVAKHLLAAVGMYLFASRLMSRRAAFFAAAVYPLSSFSVVWFMGFAAITAAIIPWFLWALLRLAEDDAAFTPWLAAVAFSLFFLLTAGFPSLAGFTLYAGGFFFIFWVFRRMFAMGAEVARGRFLALKAAHFAAAVVLGLGLAAYSIFPTLTYLDWIDIAYREKNALKGLDLPALWQLINPLVHGNDADVSFRGPSNYSESSMYMGTATLILGALAALAPDRRRASRGVVFFFLGMAVVCVILIFNLFSILAVATKLPIFNSSVSSRLIALLVFAGCILGGLGLDRVSALAREGASKTAVVVMAGLGACVAILLLMNAELSDWLHPNTTPLTSHFFYSWMIVSLLFAVTATAVIRAVNRKGLGMGPYLALMALTLAELAFYAAPQIPSIDRRDFFSTTPEIEFLKERLEPHERLLSLDSSFIINGVERMYGFNIPIAHGLQPTRVKKLGEALTRDIWVSDTAAMPFSRKTDLESPLITLFGVKLIVNSPNIDLFQVHGEGLRERYEELLFLPGVMRIYRNKRYAGAAFAVNRIQQADTEDALLAALTEKSFDPTQTAIVEEAPPAPFVQAEASDAANQAAVVGYEGETMTYRASSPQPFILATTETHYPGWRAFDGEGRPLEIFRVNGLFRGVALPAGERQVRFEYRPEGIGGALSMLSLLLILIIAAFSWRGRSRANSKDRKPDAGPITQETNAP